MTRTLRRIAALTMVLSAIMGFTATPANAHADWLCDGGSDWDFWENGPSQFIHYRACIDHTASDVLGKTQVYITWNGFNNAPEYEYLGLVTQIQKNTGAWTTITSDVCDRTNGAQSPGAHNTTAEAFNCPAPNANRTAGNWRVRQNVCWDLVGGPFRCLTDTAAGFNFSPTHSL